MSFTDFCHNEITKANILDDFVVFNVGKSRPRTLKVKKEKISSLLIALVETPSDAEKIVKNNKEIIEAVIRKYAL